MTGGAEIIGTTSCGCDIAAGGNGSVILGADCATTIGGCDIAAGGNGSVILGGCCDTVICESDATGGFCAAGVTNVMLCPLSLIYLFISCTNICIDSTLSYALV